MRYAGFAGLIALLVIISGTWLVGAGETEAGKALYAKKCASCHGPNGEGNEKIAKMLKVEMRHLGTKEIQAKSDADLSKVITEGTDKKKPVKGLTDADLANVIAYVRTLAKK
ncbi:MAG: cytochrome c [Acidobacteria bacterium]|nr:cytochrome c [Acidobacteriota bacterium]